MSFYFSYTILRLPLALFAYILLILYKVSLVASVHPISGRNTAGEVGTTRWGTLWLWDKLLNLSDLVLS